MLFVLQILYTSLPAKGSGYFQVTQRDSNVLEMSGEWEAEVVQYCYGDLPPHSASHPLSRLVLAMFVF